MLKKTLPIIIGCVVGLYVLLEFYVPHYHAKELRLEILDYAAILGAAAFVLGAINVFQVTWPKIRRREEDWPYKVVMLVAASAMLLAGVSWHVFGHEDAPQTKVVAGAAGTSIAQVVIATEPGTDVALDGRALDAAHIKELGGDPAALGAGKPLTLDVAPGNHEVAFSRRAVGYSAPTASVTLAAGERATITAAPRMLWGKDGRVKTWLYDYVFAPCNSTMFALLAFFVVSAAFRAFRARNTEAALLLGSAIFILIGLAPFGRLISDSLPDVANWIIDIPSNSGRRAIMMGAAIGGIATGLRIILGLERSHLGEG